MKEVLKSFSFACDDYTGEDQVCSKFACVWLLIVDLGSKSYAGQVGKKRR